MSLIEAGRINVADLGAHEEAHRLWPVHHTQLSSGSFCSSTDFVRTEQVIVYRQSWNRRMTVSGASPPGYLMLGTTTDGSVQVNWCGSDLSRQRVACSQPSGEIDFTTSEHANQVVALVRADALARSLGDEELADRLRGPHMESTEHQGHDFISTFVSILTRYADRSNLGTNPRECEELESEVISAIAACAGLGPDPDANLPRRREALRCAIAYCEGSPEPISVRQLAEAVGVSRRTLEYVVHEGLGITPLQFMKRGRMNRAYRFLRLARPDSTMVSDVARHWGFSDPGRFAADYKRLFGEFPSRTLSKPRPRPSLLHR